MKILFVWTGVTSYMADCWRLLQQVPRVELKIIIELVASGKEFDRQKVLESLDACVVENGSQASGGKRRVAGDCRLKVEAFLGTWKPQVVFAVGWHSKLVRGLVERKDWRDVPKICCCDMPWRWQLRCFGARIILRRYLRQFYGMMVPGKSGYMYARWLGFPKSRVFTGEYGIDVSRFKGADEKFCGFNNQGRFLYLGRFSPEKRLDVLMRAYNQYRALGGAWELDVFGAGQLPEIQVKHRPNVFPFVQPDKIPELYASHVCLTMASDFDPWPLVVLECCASGRPVIVTDRCTNHYEFVKSNGIVVRHGDVKAMAQAMLRMEQEYDEFRSAAETEGRLAAANYSCAAWCERVQEICRKFDIQIESPK